MMKKNSTKGYLILGILFAFVSAVAFAVPTAKTAAFWIAYGFTVAAFGAQILVWNIGIQKGETLKSKFLGFPIVHIGIVYLIVQIVAFAVFLIVPVLPTWSAIVVCSCIAGIFAVLMIVGDMAKGEIQRVEANVQKKVFYIRSLQVDVEMLADAESNADTKKALEQLAETIRFSDPMSNELLSDLEEKIAGKVEVLKTATDKTPLISELNSLISERNKKCKILK